MKEFVVSTLMGLTLSLIGCTQKTSPPVPSSPNTSVTPSPSALVERGRSVYMANCISCHNPNPTRPGSLGPELAGEPLDMIEAQVVLGHFPEGHPRRSKGNVKMPPLPHLKNEVQALHAFLNSKFD